MEIPTVERPTTKPRPIDKLSKQWLNILFPCGVICGAVPINYYLLLTRTIRQVL